MKQRQKKYIDKIAKKSPKPKKLNKTPNSHGAEEFPFAWVMIWILIKIMILILIKILDIY